MPRAVGIEVFALVLMPVLCMSAIFLLDADDVLSLEVWEWFPGNVAFLLVPKGVWWAIWRVFPSRAARLGGSLGADALGLLLTLLALTLPGEAAWLWYGLLVVPAMVVGSGLALVTERSARARDERLAKRPSKMLVGGVVMLAAIVSLPLSQRHWRRIAFTVDLKPGSVTSASFRVPARTTYQVELVTERRIPFDELECLLGYPRTLSGPCPANSSPLDLAWSVQSGGRAVAEPAADHRVEVGGASTMATLSRDLGQVTIPRGTGYEVVVTSHRDASVLNTTNPRIVAEASDWPLRPTPCASDVLAALGFGLWGVGLLQKGHAS